jgi:hypothetical protein
MASVFEMLDDEWRRLGVDRTAARRLGDVCFLAGSARTLTDVERFVRTATPPEADRVLLALVNRAVVGDDLAARVLLQLLLPGTRSLARRWWALGDHDERAAAAVMAVYHRIRTYPVERRPARVAANVLMDAAQELRRSVPRIVTTPSPDPAVHHSHRCASRGEHCGDHTHLTGDHDTPALNPAVELAQLLQDAVNDGILDPGDAQLIAHTRIAGHRVADIAHHRGLRPRTLWDRRQRAEHTLAHAHTHARSA